MPFSKAPTNFPCRDYPKNKHEVPNMAVETTFNIWNALFSLSGVIAGGYVGYKSARRISDRNARASACAKFRSAIAPAIAYLEAEESYSTPDNNRPKAGKFLFENYFVHASAIEEFRPFVRAEDQPAYQKAWEEYKDLEPLGWGGDSPIFLAEQHNPERPHKYVVAKFQRILQFSET